MNHLQLPSDSAAKIDPAALNPSSRSGDVLSEAASTRQQDWLNGVLVLRKDLSLTVRSERNQTRIFIEDPLRGKFFRIGEMEYELIALLDGKRTVGQVLERWQEKQLAGGANDARVIGNSDGAKRILLWLVESNLAIGSNWNNAQRLQRQAERIDRQQVLNWLNPISIKIRLGNPDALIARLQPMFDWLFSRWFFVLWMLLAGYSAVLLYTRWDALESASVGILSGYRWAWLLTLWVILKVVHELAHGIACRRYGGEVPEAGILFLLFTPLAYVNVTSSWGFPNRWHRMVVAAAGIYVELLVAFVSLIIWAQTTGLCSDIAFQVFVMASVTTVVFNANPLMRFDGYFLLADGLGIPNLYQSGVNDCSLGIRHWLFGVPAPPLTSRGAERSVIAVYGVLAFLWKLTIGAGLILAASVMFQGAGLVLSASGLAFWYGIPLWQQVKSLFLGSPERRARLGRTLVSATLLLIVVTASIRWLSAPVTKSAPAMVEFADTEVIRAAVDGFIEEVLIADGQSVEPGQVVLRLANPQLVNEVYELERLVDEAETQARIYREEKDFALEAAELNHRDQRQRELESKRLQLEQLTIYANSRGVLHERNLDHRIGTYAQRGDAICRIIVPTDRQLVVAVEQADLKSFPVQQGTSMEVHLSGWARTMAQLDHVDPKATKRPRYPALCASAGGPLAVRQVSDDDQRNRSTTELLSPRFYAFLKLSEQAGQPLEAGQIGTVRFQASQRSLGSYLYLSVVDWFDRKLKAATRSQSR